MLIPITTKSNRLLHIDTSRHVTLFPPRTERV